MIAFVWPFFQNYGWFVVFGAITAALIYKTFIRDQVVKIQLQREEELRKKFDEDVHSKRHEELRRIREKQQQLHDAVAFEKQQKEKEAEKEKLEQWKKEQQKKTVLEYTLGTNSVNKARKQESKSAEEIVDEYIHSKPVVMFSKSWCPFCRKAKSAFATFRLNQKDFEYIELDERTDLPGDEIQNVFAKKYNSRSVPKVFVDGQCIGGGDDTMRLLQDGQLEVMIFSMSSHPMGFQTAGLNIFVPVCNTALGAVKRKFDETVDVDNGSEQLNNRSGVPTFRKRLEADSFDEEDSFEDNMAPVGSQFVGFRTASERPIAVSDEALEASKRKMKNILNDASDRGPTSDLKESGINGASVLPGFMTASDRKVTVSAEALEVSRKRMRQAIEEHVDTSTDVTTPTEEHEFSGFLTASDKKVTVSNEALQASRDKLQALDKENKSLFVSSTGYEQNIELKSSQQPLQQFRVTEVNESCVPSSARYVSPFGALPDDVGSNAFQSPVRGLEPVETTKGFVSPLIQTLKRNCSLMSPLSSGATTPVRAKKSATPFRPPIVAKDNAFVLQKPVTVQYATSSPSSSSHTMTTRDAVVSVKEERIPIVGKFAQLKHFNQRNVEVVGVVVRVLEKPSVSGEVIKFSMELSDLDGTIITVKVTSKRKDLTFSVSDVVRFRKVFAYSVNGLVNLTVNDATEIDLEPKGSHAEELRYRKSTKTNGTFNLNLHCIGRLDSTTTQSVIVKAYIQEFRTENPVYLGCATCKKKMGTSNVDEGTKCAKCDSSEKKYFYLLQADVCDFSGSVWITMFDPIATRILGVNAEEAFAMSRYQPEMLRKRMAKVEFIPLIFKLRANGGRWTVDDFRPVDFNEFNPYLKQVVEKKGYKHV